MNDNQILVKINTQQRSVQFDDRVFTVCVQDKSLSQILG